MVRQPLVVPAAKRGQAPKEQAPGWRRRSLLRVRRPAWSAPPKPPAGS
ncbi:MAG: hypothetical protein U0R71_11645 [Solirubrobacterales bacterium]